MRERTGVRREQGPRAAGRRLRIAPVWRMPTAQCARQRRVMCAARLALCCEYLSNTQQQIQCLMRERKCPWHLPSRPRTACRRLRIAPVWRMPTAASQRRVVCAARLALCCEYLSNTQQQSQCLIREPKCPWHLPSQPRCRALCQRRRQGHLAAMPGAFLTAERDGQAIRAGRT